MNNYLIDRYRKESPVFSPQAGNVYKEFVMPGNVDSMKSYLLRLTGGNKRAGQYYDPRENVWKTALIPSLEAALVEIPEKFNRVRQYEANLGNRPPETMPDELQDENDKLEARLTVLMEEAEFLTKEIKAASQDAPENLPPVRPRREWGAGKLRDGILIEQGGMRVRPDKEGLLRIEDERSPYDGIPVWRFKAQVYKPMHWEYCYREQTETEAAKKENRPPEKVPYPEAPVWDKKADKITYPDYSANTMIRLEKQLENNE